MEAFSLEYICGILCIRILCNGKPLVNLQPQHCNWLLIQYNNDEPAYCHCARCRTFLRAFIPEMLQIVIAMLHAQKNNSGIISCIVGRKERRVSKSIFSF
jgi:hypothetical protein